MTISPFLSNNFVVLNHGSKKILFILSNYQTIKLFICLSYQILILWPFFVPKLYGMGLKILITMMMDLDSHVDLEFGGVGTP